MLDFGALPPEINSGRMYAGPGSGPLLAAAAAWDALAAELYSAAASYGSTIEGLTVAPWMGPSSITMAAAVAPYVAWISVTAGQAEQAGAQAKIAAGVYETAFAATVPPPVIEANRALLMSLVATNIFGQNTPAIAATEAHYAEMWAQDAAAMYGYAGSSATASQLAPFSEPPQTTNPSATAAQSAVVAQAAGAAASSDITAQLSQLISLLPSTLQSLATTATATSASAGWDTVLQSITTILANLTGPYSIIGLGAIPGGWWLTFGQILGLAQNAPEAHRWWHRPQQWRPACPECLSAPWAVKASGVPCPSMASAPTSSHDRPPPGDPVGGGFPGKRQGHDGAAE